jgi:hypothetical protein
MDVTYNAVGIREDLENVIYDITPTETPLLSMAGRKTAKQRKHEWQTDRSAAGDKDNSVIEGLNPTADSSTRTVRFANYCQLMDKVCRVSSTELACDAAGRADQMAYQMGKRSLELKKDLDAAMSQSNASTAGSSLTPALMGGLEVWLGFYGNTDATVTTAHGTACGADNATTPGVLLTTGVPDRALTDSSTVGTLTEAIFKRVLARAITDGANITTLLTTPTVKAAIAKNFAGIATRYREVPRGQAAIVSGADLYVSDFGEITLRYSRQIRTLAAGAAAGGASTVIYGLDPDMLAVAYLQPFNEFPLAKTGHADTRVLAVEAALEVKNVSGLFKILVADGAGWIVA